MSDKYRLAEATGGRVPLKKGKVPRGPNEWLQLLDLDWDDMDRDEWEGILKALGVNKAQGGRVPLAGGLIARGGNWFIKNFKSLIDEAANPGPWSRFSKMGAKDKQAAVADAKE